MEQLNFKLSKRLIDVANFLPAGATFADIGSDHAYLPCYVCAQDPSATAIAGEVNQGPFDSARATVRMHGLTERITVRLGDGLDVLEQADDIKQIVIAGMGGGLIKQILADGKAKLETVYRLILQPNVNARKLRIWLHEEGFVLTAEQILEENGHIYEILVADREGTGPYEEGLLERQFLFGPYLLKNKTPVFYRKWRKEADKLRHIIGQMEQATHPDAERIDQFKQELAWMEEELSHE
ncbi:tRNA (adenine(22)-N(1))-methyltransferase [Oceanobacillus alkalisoli]|uniref:tRNA (adenine(22)-N(1))-methyltransferase n=1 Tax=Oceanobacillus alkalisoli TaxID=2925113 RepID=UPI001EEFD5CC|nr:tRNA (adenine(22)-N(1))-methyltransferase TrmK [Oceanobacillus alkalisoli]MCF3941788.1 tRNA (adenine(22)-N(1))-methyltransferase TrmK [Oceanobacillus alkalisoli]MCG5103068.1 tRNA (adenine(22)-N(1))-methyltransferase TrmK [Oceanobacillus alkalisoli]